jgi:hypothetical protein
MAMLNNQGVSKKPRVHIRGIPGDLGGGELEPRGPRAYGWNVDITGWW